MIERSRVLSTVVLDVLRTEVFVLQSVERSLQAGSTLKTCRTVIGFARVATHRILIIWSQMNDADWLGTVK